MSRSDEPLDPFHEHLKNQAEEDIRAYKESAQNGFMLAIVMNLYKSSEPDPEVRKTAVEKFVAILETKAEQEVARARELMESPAMKLLGQISGVDVDQMVEKAHKKLEIVKEHLLDLFV